MQIASSPLQPDCGARPRRRSNSRTGGDRPSAARFCGSARGETSAAKHLPGPTKESKMGAPSSEFCNPHASSTCTAVAVTLVSLLAATMGAATAHELLIYPPVIPAGDPASRQLEQAKPRTIPIHRSAAHSKRRRRDSIPPPCRGSSRSTRKPISLSSFGKACRISCVLPHFGVPGRWIPRSGTSGGCRRTAGISATLTVSRALANSAPRSMSKERWRKFSVRLRA
jgi:hypothetical protein